MSLFKRTEGARDLTASAGALWTVLTEFTTLPHPCHTDPSSMHKRFGADPIRAFSLSRPFTTPERIALGASGQDQGSHRSEQRLPRHWDKRLIVAIATPLQSELVAKIRDTDHRLEVHYEPDLLPPQRYTNDHQGVRSFRRQPEAERRWRTLIDGAEVLFGLPGDSPRGLAAVVRSNARLHWVQATAAGAAEQVRAARLSRQELQRVVVTTASGVHAGPLAEFCILGLLAFTKNLPRLIADQRRRHWNHYPVGELAGRTLAVVGLGAVGTEVAKLATAMGMRVIGVSRHADESQFVDRVFPTQHLHRVLPEADAIVLTLPLTGETENLLDARAIAKMKRGAILVNVGRGRVIDEAALVDALRDGRLAGAALDVFSTEPLPGDSPLWELPNVLVSPHTAALSEKENERIVALFQENLLRYLAATPLINEIDPDTLD